MTINCLCCRLFGHLLPPYIHISPLQYTTSLIRIYFDLISLVEPYFTSDSCGIGQVQLVKIEMYANVIEFCRYILPTLAERPRETGCTCAGVRASEVITGRTILTRVGGTLQNILYGRENIYMY